MVTNIQPVEIDGKHYVDVSIDGHANCYGPYPDDEAKAMAARIAAVCRCFHWSVHQAAPHNR
jgi:hypothetical protein